MISEKTLRHWISQIRPSHLALPLLIALFGSALAGKPNAVSPFIATASALYAGRLLSLYLHSKRSLRVLAGSFAAALVLLVPLYSIGADAVAYAFFLSAFLLETVYTHCRDKATIGSITSYPLINCCILLGSFALQSGTLTPLVVFFSTLLFFILAGVKVVDQSKLVNERGLKDNILTVLSNFKTAKKAGYLMAYISMMFFIPLAWFGLMPKQSLFSVMLAYYMMEHGSRQQGMEAKWMIRGAAVMIFVLSYIYLYEV